MVRVQPQLGARRLLPAPDAHLEGPLTADTELELALRAGEVHAAAEREEEAVLARRAGHAVLGQLPLQPRRLVVGVVVRLPLGELLAAYALVRLQPLRLCAICTKSISRFLQVHFEFPVLTGSKHFAHEIALHSGQTSRLYLMSAMKPDEH